MTYRVSTEQKPSYLHVTVRGTNSVDNVRAYQQDVILECQTSGCKRLLLEDRLDGPPLDVLDLFSLSEQGAKMALGMFEAVAYVGDSLGESTYFAETVSVNRGLPVATFSSVEEAERWLLESKERI